MSTCQGADTAGSASRSGRTRKKSILAETRLKFFGPTLDESVLYGIDRLIDSLWQSSPARPPRNSFESDEQNMSSYQSCETLPLQTEEETTPEHSSASKLLFPKLSQDEMDYLLNAIERSRRKSYRRAKDTKSSPGTTQPQLRQTRWAIARINEYDDGAKTYEIMKSFDEKRLPSEANPADTEIVFAVLKNGASLCLLPIAH